MDRFDLIFVLSESEDEEELREYAEQKLERLSRKVPNYNRYLKMHIALAKKIKPVLTEESSKLIIEYYINLTKSSSSSLKFRSKRMLETIVRIVKCHCKLKLKETVQVDDVKTWNSLIQSSLNIQNQPFRFQMILKIYPFAFSLIY